jgi:GT2 family glycosyltransferase
MLCAILIPTRKRFDRLLKTVASVYGTTNASDQVEIIIRCDSDDYETTHRVLELPAAVKVMSGPRSRGYAAINLFYTDMAAATKAEWIWIMNDDATIQGSGWADQLAKVSEPRCIVQPELIGWGPSEYSRSEGGPFPVVRNKCWEAFGMTDIPDPADAALDDLLRVRNGWKTVWLDGIKVQHDRDTDDKLAVHRAL